nr:tetratricopeptide repeat protein [Candidatus Sigynarchaeota archaeon]
MNSKEGSFKVRVAAKLKQFGPLLLDATAYCNLGDELQASGDFKGAVEAYRKATIIEPGHVDAWINLGIALLESGDIKGAIAAQQKAIAINPNSAYAHINLGVALLKSGNMPGAIEATRTAIKLWPKRADGWHNLGIMLADSGDSVGAMDAFRKEIAIMSDDVNEKYEDSTPPVNLKGIIEACREVLAIKPDLVEVWNTFATALRKSRDFPGAIEAYRKVIAIKPDDADALHNLGVVLVDSGDLPGAIDAFRKAIAIKPDHADAWLDLALAMEDSGDIPGAIETYNKALAVRPVDVYLWTDLGATLLKKEARDLEKAKRCFQKALELKPDYPLAFYNMACAHSLAGDARKAVEFLEKAIKANPGKYQKMASTDHDFDPVRDDPWFQALI